MAIKKDTSSPKKGMNRDKAVFDLDKIEYSFAMNANFHDEHGSGQINLQNEASNIYCSGFIEGYKVIGHKFDINADRTYFFLTNPTTGYSEIGYIESFYNIEGLEQVEKECNCNITVVLENPLEEQTQTAICTYNTIISDECTLVDNAVGCLDFSIDFPIYENNIHIKDENTGKVMYWTDNNNPQRYIQLDRLDIYTQDTDDCTGDVVETCMQCDKLRIYKLFNKPCIGVATIQNGGNLRAGTYEAEIAYCTSTGVEISDYYSKTNPIKIHDKNNNILDQTNLDYLTNFAIGLDISDLDTKYEYYKIAVFYRSGLDGAVTLHEVGVYPISNKKVSIISIVDSPTVDYKDATSRKPFYTKARGLTSGNGYLFHYGVEAHREINLQPIVNLLGGHIKWSTVQAEEDIYDDGAHASNFISYMRDEVVPVSIKFFLDGGYETPNFTFIPRPPTDSENEVLGEEFKNDKNTASILANGDNCGDNLRDKRWQFENTASIIGRCEVNNPNGTEEVEKEVEGSCYVEEAGEIKEVETISGPASVAIDTNQDLVTYINENQAEILTSTNPDWLEIQNALLATYPSDICEAEFEEDCDTPALVDFEILALSTGTETAIEASQDFGEYDRPTPPVECSAIATTGAGGTPGMTEDTVFRNTYMRPLETIYYRSGAMANTTCTAANSISALISPQVDNAFFMQYAGALGTNTTLIQSAITVSATDVASGYTSNLHINALWYKVDFNGQDSIIVETSLPTAPMIDDAYQKSMRVSFFDSCSATTDIAAYGQIITDVNLANDPQKFFELDATDFPSGTVYIAIDAPILSEADWTITLTGIIGEANIVIDSVNYLSEYATDFTSTADTFVLNHASTILSTHNVIVTAVAGVLYFRGSESNYLSTTVVNVSGTHNGIIGLVEKYFVLSPPEGCTNIYSREVIKQSFIRYTDLTFAKRMNYTVNCIFSIPVLNGCDPVPYEYGKFSYWESTETYPCNGELYDSSNLVIYPSDFTDADTRVEFEDNYGAAILPSGEYDLSTADFRDVPIRHYKFPCATKVPFMSFSKTGSPNQNPGGFNKSVVYPIGFSIDNQTIKDFLDIAVREELITLEERSRINKYEIFRGDRSVDKSIIAKGLLFDTYKYIDHGGDSAFYPNYPLNTLGNDQLSGGQAHPFSSTGNKWFTFHSPETSFYKPSLPREMKIEGYQYGKSASYFDIVKDHPTYVLLGDKAYQLATSLAIAEVAIKTVLKILEVTLAATSAGTPYGIAPSLVLAAVYIGVIVGAVFEVGQIRYQWIETFRSLGHPHQFAYYQAAIGHYNFFVPNTLPEESLRGMPTITYMKDGRHMISDEVGSTSLNYNNQDREESVFINLGEGHKITYPSTYVNYDNSALSGASRRGYDGTGASGKIEGNAASPYVSLKQYLPAQYGSISSVKWIYTGFCGDLSSSNGCEPIFGGDVYISRFALKRKHSFFTANSHGLAPLTPFKYSDYFNILPGTDTNRYYIDYLTQDDSESFVKVFVFPTNRSKYNLDAYSGGNEFYIKPPAKFYLFSYGIPYFLVESVFNCNYRYAKREKHENFYPNINNIIEYTQESNVSIREPNTYFYNFVYSSLPATYPNRVLPEDYNQKLYEGIDNLENTVIYSAQDNSERELTDAWLIYKALDSYDFSKAFGKLIDMDRIESEQIFARFENGFTMFGSIDQLRDRVTPDTKNIGAGGIFAGRSVNFNKTDLGYGGTQHKAKVSCEFGHFWTDAKRGQVFKLQPNAKGLDEVTKGLEKWFKENLPFKITQSISGISQDVLDNNFKGLGITMGWDARLKRVFLTKLDYKPLKGISVENIGTDFYIKKGEDFVKVELTDTDYFEDCSFTVAYSPMTDSWISFYSFKPNYYITYNNYFQTGVNYSVDTSEIGVWSHLPFLSSYQVFYGKLYPFIIEGAMPSKMTNSVLHSIEYWMDVRKYYNKYDFADIVGSGFNKTFIYNNQQNSGQLNLIHQKNNDLSQSLNYPKHNLSSIDILQSEVNGKWSFNYFYNIIKNERSGLPVWLNDCNQIDKTLNNKLLDYTSSYKDRLRGDYFILRLQQDFESRYKMIYRFNTDARDYYE